MDLKLSVHRPSGIDDVLVSLDASATLGHLAATLRAVQPAGIPTGEVTLAVARGGRWQPLPADVVVAEAGICSGMSVSIVGAGSGSRRAATAEPAAVLTVLVGPDAGMEVQLPVGDSVIGRSSDCAVRLRDPLVSKQHAVLHISDHAEIIDLNSSNGVEVSGLVAARSRIAAEAVVTLGDTQLQVRMHAAASAGVTPEVQFNRSPLLEPVYTGVTEELPEAPERERRQPLPILSLLAPLVLGGVLWLFSHQLLAVLFIALSPLLMLAGLLENQIFARRAFKRAAREFRAGLEESRHRAQTELTTEQAMRLTEDPSAAECISAATELAPLLWSRSPAHPRFLRVRLGLAESPSRSGVVPSSLRTGDRELRAEAETLAAGFGSVPAVPSPSSLLSTPLGVAGPGCFDVARGLLVQLLALHAPGDLTLVALVPGSAMSEWSWLRWVPHSVGNANLLGPLVLGADPQSCGLAVAALEQLVEERVQEREVTLPAVLVVVDDAAPIERGRLLQAVRRGHDVGIHLLWVAPKQTNLPAECRRVLALSGVDAQVVDVEAGSAVTGVQVERVPVVTAEAFARQLAPLVDAAAVGDGQSDLPRSAGFLDQPGARDLVGPGEAIAERWREGGSLPDSRRRRRAGTLRALVGSGAGAPFHLDLREHGPHALVGGTTGSGKSEFLQSWILGMALAHSPNRVTFLLVDYKGGSAFSECRDLPHTVGMVTDLTPRLVTRALTSLKAELRYREQLLSTTGVPDLLAMEQAGAPETPPSLVIVVDEFAALVQEVPEFVDGVIDVAQRGRSLGLHLILATQRPAGVIKDNLRANTNLRVALRMADEDDRVDVIGSTKAAQFDPAIPGRAVAKTGPGRSTAFQSLYVGGRTPDMPPPPSISVAPLRFGAPQPWQPPEETDVAPETGPKDIQRLVQAVSATAKLLDLAEPRKPWLPELAQVSELADLPSKRRDDALVFGVVDVPEKQSRAVAVYRPDTDGAMAVFGTGGSGKSATLRTIALAAGAASLSGGGTCHVYGIDFGSRGLAPLEDLPHVGAVIVGDDHERIARLLTRLRGVVEERALRYSGVRAGTIGEYRRLGNRPDEARIILLIDNFAAFRQAYESGTQSRMFDIVQGLALDGRQVGVHLVLSADRPNAVPSALASSVQKRLALRLVQETDLAMVGLKEDAFGPESPPGRGYLDGLEMQVAVLGADANPAAQGERIQRLGEVMRSHGMSEADQVERLAERVQLNELPILVNDLPALGVADDTLLPIGFSYGGPFVLAGPPQSGRSTVLATLACSLRRARPELPLLHVGQRRSLATSMLDWQATASTADEAVELAERWTALAPTTRFALFIEGIPDYLGTLAESYLQDLVNACAAAGNCVVAEGDTSLMGSSWPLLQAVKSARHGLVLQPDQTDGDALLRTMFPRLSRSEFPPGRGLYVKSGRLTKVQVAVPE